MPENAEDDQEVLRVANEIARYLQEREQVADTLEGIARWWLLKQRLQEETQRVEKAIHYLCKQGLIDQRELPDGTVLYISPKNE